MFWAISGAVAIAVGLIFILTANYSVNEWSDGTTVYQSWQACSDANWDSSSCSLLDSVAKVDPGKIGLGYSLFGVAGFLFNFAMLGYFSVKTAQAVLEGTAIRS